jgi:hypothetical protein
VDHGDALQTLLGERLTEDGRKALRVITDAWNDLSTAAQYARDLAGDGPACESRKFAAARIRGHCVNCSDALDRALANAGHETTASQAARHQAIREQAERSAASTATYRRSASSSRTSEARHTPTRARLARASSSSLAPPGGPSVGTSPTR